MQLIFISLTHFSENLFNVTVICSNAEVQEKEGFESGGDVLYGLDDHYEVEWVYGVEEGLALKDGFWGKERLDSRSPGGTGKDSAEVWFKKVLKRLVKREYYIYASAADKN